MNPPKSILDDSFRYTPSASTDIRKTFRRRLRELDEQRKREAANAEEAQAKVQPMRKGR